MRKQEKEAYGLHHIGIYVEDREEAIKFYEEALGFKLAYKFETKANNGFLKIACVRLQTFLVELLQLPDTTGVKASALNTWNHFGLYVKDIHKTCARLEKDPRITFEEGDICVVDQMGDETVQYQFFRGLNGERIELLEATDLYEE